jgi:hypothetical protein
MGFAAARALDVPAAGSTAGTGSRPLCHIQRLNKGTLYDRIFYMAKRAKRKSGGILSKPAAKCKKGGVFAPISRAYPNTPEQRKQAALRIAERFGPRTVAAVQQMDFHEPTAKERETAASLEAMALRLMEKHGRERSA